MYIYIYIYIYIYAAYSSSTFLIRYIQGHLNTWACWAVSQGPYKHRGPM